MEYHYQGWLVLIMNNCFYLSHSSTEHEQKEYEAMLQVRESVQLVENAMLEKDQVNIIHSKTSLAVHSMTVN